MELTHDQLVARRADRPASGWRAAVFACTGGVINPGPGRRQRQLTEMQQIIRTPLPGGGSYRIAVTGNKGGVGRTTVAAGLAATLAANRGDQIIAVDAAPDAGTLADRLVGPPPVTIRELLRRLADTSNPPTMPELDTYLRLAGRLRVLASQQDPAACTSLDPTEYQQVVDFIGKHIGLAVTDCSAGVAHPTTARALQTADSLVIVGTLTVDGASRAAHTLAWLDHHGHAARAAQSIVVLTGDIRTGDVDIAAVRNHFQTRARGLVEIPFDPQLACGGRLELERLRRPTQDAFTTLAAMVAAGFSSTPAHAAISHAA